MIKKLIVITLLIFLSSSNVYSKGTGDYPGGPCYTGLGGQCYDGLGGPAYDGLGGPAYDGLGGPAYDGLGGPCYDGLGGPAYSGLGGPCYKTTFGFIGDCPKACRCKACKKN